MDEAIKIFVAVAIAALVGIILFLIVGSSSGGIMGSINTAIEGWITRITNAVGTGVGPGA